MIPVSAGVPARATGRPWVSASRVSTDPDTAGGVGFTRARSLVVAHACGSAG